MSGSFPRLIVHLGQHKTGSKALQSFLALHAGRLRDRGIVYPVSAAGQGRDRAYAISHFHLFARLRCAAMEALGETAEAERFWSEHGAACPPFASLRACFEALDGERVRAGADTLVLSAEDLFDLHTSHELGFQLARVRQAAALLGGLAREFRYETRLVVYLRRPDHLLAAHYAQFVKGPTREDLDFDRFAAAFAPRLRAGDLLEAWADGFGADNLLVRAYEPDRLAGGIVADFFPRGLGFDLPPEWSAPPNDRESVNASPDRDHLEFIRQLKRGRIAGGAILTVTDVLNTTLAGGAPHARHRGVAAWLSPAARRALLAAHATEADAIAARFLDGRGPLFSEPPPADDPSWEPWSELSAEQLNAIARRVAGNVGFRERWRRRIRAWRRGLRAQLTAFRPR